MIRYLTLAFAIAGAADTGQFLVARRHLFKENRRRAGGTAAGVLLWSGLGLSVLMDQRVGRRTVGLASCVWLANVGLLVIHLRSRLVSSRVFLGPALATAALGSSVAASSLEGR
jgi:hypothetical protein